MAHLMLCSIGMLAWKSRSFLTLDSSRKSLSIAQTSQGAKPITCEKIRCTSPTHYPARGGKNQVEVHRGLGGVMLCPARSGRRDALPLLAVTTCAIWGRELSHNMSQSSLTLTLNIPSSLNSIQARCKALGLWEVCRASPLLRGAHCCQVCTPPWSFRVLHTSF